MATTTIELQVDADLARLYEEASPATKRKVLILFEVVLRGMTEKLVHDITSADELPLSDLMDTISDRAQARGLTPEIADALIADEEVVDVLTFENDDDGYLRWVDANPDGFVINASKSPTPSSYCKLHAASCNSITTPKRTNYTTNQYIKVCSLDKQSLIDWGTRYSRNFSLCQSCQP